MRTERFSDRRSAGRQLGDVVAADGPLHDPVVFALPRGGVPVAYEVAIALRAPLEVFVTRKLGAPQHPEFGFGAVAEDGTRVLNDHAVRALGLTPAEIDRIAGREEDETKRRVMQYRQDRPLPDVVGRDVIVVDDGLATGVTAEAALVAIRKMKPHRLFLAAPTCANQTVGRLRPLAEIRCVITPRDLYAVGEWYDNFDQTSDDEVLTLLAESRRGAQRADAR